MKILKFNIITTLIIAAYMFQNNSKLELFIKDALLISLSITLIIIILDILSISTEKFISKIRI